MWPRTLILTLLVALLVGGAPGAAPVRGSAPDGSVSRGPAVVPPAAVPSATLPRAGVPRAARGSWAWPIAPPRAVVRPYLAPPTSYGAGHRGIDIRAAADAPVLSPDDGIVHFAGVVVDRPVLSIEHEGGVLSSFEPVQSTLVAGDRVRRGEMVGTVLAGHCATPCLHLGARIDGEYLNPLLFLGGVPWSVLLPPG